MSEAAAMVKPAYDALIEAAETLFSVGALGQAQAAYGAAVELEPKKLQGYVGASKCARASGDPAASLAVFDAALAIYPDHTGVRMERAADFMALGRMEEAEAAYADITRMDSGQVAAFLALAKLCLQRGDTAAALAHYQAAAHAAPETIWPWLEAAAILRESARWEEAEASYLSALAIARDSVIAWLGLGLCARARGHHKVALAHFQAAILADPASLAARLEAAGALRELGMLAPATGEYRHVLDVAPDHVPALIGLALCARQRGEHAESLAWFEAARDIAPTAGIYAEMAVDLRALGRGQESDDALDQAASRDPRNVAALIRRGEHLLQADPAAALAFFQGAAAEQPEALALQLGVADALIALGRTEEVLAYLSQPSATFAQAPEIATKLVNVRRQTGDHVEALRLARDATAQFPQQFWLWVERFLVEILLSPDAEVAACLAAMPAVSRPEQAIATRLHGNFAERQGDLHRAVAQYVTAALASPDNPGIQFDLVRVKLLLLDIDGARTHLRRYCALMAPVTKARQQSVNISQTHFGQMIDEYSMDREVLRELQGLNLLPAPERAAGLRGVVRDNPDHTAAAVSLLATMRQTGALAGFAPAEGQGIPPRIAQFWDSPAVPADVLALMQSWRAQNPAYHYQLFDDAAAQAFLVKWFPPMVLLAYRRVREPAQKADIFRLAWLAAEGGVYADADDRCLAPLDALLPEHAGLVLYQEDHGTLGNNFIAAVKGHKIILHALKLVVLAVNRGDTDNIWLASGPGLLTRAVAQVLAATDSGTLPDGIMVLERQTLFGSVAIHCTAGYKRTDRHWGNSSFAKPRDKTQPESLGLPQKSKPLNA
jgi:tetratricopeptide (TPR) repeat protein